MLEILETADFSASHCELALSVAVLQLAFDPSSRVFCNHVRSHEYIRLIRRSSGSRAANEQERRRCSKQERGGSASRGAATQNVSRVREWRQSCALRQCASRQAHSLGTVDCCVSIQS